MSGSRWDQPGVPHKGWHCVDVVDLRADVKYQATPRATQLAAGEPTNAQAVLLTTDQPPSEAVRLSKRLRVKILVAPREAESG